MSCFFPYLSQFISGTVMVLLNAIYIETHLCRPHLVPFKAIHLIKVANLRCSLDPLKTELCTVHNSECRDSCSSWRAGAWPCQWTVTSNQLPLEYSIFSPYLCRKDGGLLGGQQISVLMNEDFCPCTVWYKNYTTSCPPAYWGWTGIESITLYEKL
jgi:hypothetical protein